MADIDQNSQKTLNEFNSTLTPAQQEIQKQITAASKAAEQKPEMLGIHPDALPAFSARQSHNEATSKAIYGEEKHYPADPKVDDLKKKFDDSLSGPQRDLLTKFKTERDEDQAVVVADVEAKRKQKGGKLDLTSSTPAATPASAAPAVPAPPSSGPTGIKTSTSATSSGGGIFGGIFSGGSGGGGFGDIIKKIGEFLNQFLAKLGIGGGASGPSVTAKSATTTAPTQVAQATRSASPSPAPQPSQQPGQQPAAQTSVAQPPAQVSAVNPVRAPAQADLTATKPTADEADRPLPAGKLSPQDAARAEALQQQVGKPSGPLPADLPVIKQTPTESSDSVKTTASADVQQQWEVLRGNFGVTEDNLAKLKTPDTTVVAALEETASPVSPRQTSGLKV